MSHCTDAETIDRLRAEIARLLEKVKALELEKDDLLAGYHSLVGEPAT